MRKQCRSTAVGDLMQVKVAPRLRAHPFAMNDVPTRQKRAPDKKLVQALLRLGRTVERASHQHPHQPIVLCKQLAALGRSVYTLDPTDTAAVDHLIAETDGVRLLFETECLPLPARKTGNA